MTDGSRAGRRIRILEARGTSFAMLGNTGDDGRTGRVETRGAVQAATLTRMERKPYQACRGVLLKDQRPKIGVDL